MELPSLVRRSLLGLLGTGLGMALMAAASRSDETQAAATSGSGLVIHGPAETLRDYCRE